MGLPSLPDASPYYALHSVRYGNTILRMHAHVPSWRVYSTATQCNAMPCNAMQQCIPATMQPAHQPLRVVSWVLVITVILVLPCITQCYALATAYGVLPSTLTCVTASAANTWHAHAQDMQCYSYYTLLAPSTCSACTGCYLLSLLCSIHPGCHC